MLTHRHRLNKTESTQQVAFVTARAFLTGVCTQAG